MVQFTLLPHFAEHVQEHHADNEAEAQHEHKRRADLEAGRLITRTGYSNWQAPF